MFTNRIDAGKQLAEKLLPYKHKEVVVLAIPRGGLPVGAEAAKVLQAPLDVSLSKKIGHPYNKEFAIGAVSLEGVIFNESKGIPEHYLEEETQRIRAALADRAKQYYKNAQPHSLKGKNIIIIDDGLATGNTMLATIELVADQNPAEIIVAVPVAHPSAIEKLERSPFLNEIICLETPFNFRAVGQFYEKFNAVSDGEAIKILEDSKAWL